MGEIATLSILLVLSGVFSGSETALVTLSLARAEALLKERRPGAKALYHLKQDPSRMLITILIGNNVVNIAASSIATVLATERLGHIGPGIAVGVLTILILVFGEITPKTLATRYSERISLLIAPPMYGLMKLLTPLVWLFGRFTGWLHDRTGVEGDPTVTESELIRMVEYGEEEGLIESGEREMIERVFALNDLEAADVMTPRYRVFELDAHRTFADVLPEILGNSYSRVPLFEKDPEEVVGILYLRDVFEATVREEADRPVLSRAHEPLFTPENQPIDELLAVLRRQKQHLSVVVDEHGAMLGVVTLEDLLEELVGEIYDESDKPRDQYKQLSGNRILVDGGTELRIIEEYFRLEIPGKPTDTVSRWILDHTERIPRVDERFVIDGLEVVVQNASRSRIGQVILGRAEARQRDDGSEAGG